MEELELRSLNSLGLFGQSQDLFWFFLSFQRKDRPQQVQFLLPLVFFKSIALLQCPRSLFLRDNLQF